MKKFSNKYGYFSSSGDEYIITDYKTPKPWVNILSNGSYGLVISQTGGGFSWKDHSEFNRVNRWHQDLIQDNWGKYFYVRNKNNGEIWSPTWMPVKTEPDSYECRYGFGYAKFITEYKGVKIILTVFIPNSDNLEIWNFDIENNSNEDVNLSITSYFEWCLGSSADHHREFHKTFLETDFDPELNVMTAAKRLWEIPLGDRGHWNIEYPYLGFISSNKPIINYDGDKESFLGQYGSLEMPKGVSEDLLNRKLGKWNDSIGTVKIDLNIKEGENENAAIFIGLEKTKEGIKNSLNNYYGANQIKEALARVTMKWKNILGSLQINTPDKAMNLMVNKWLPYQAITGRLMGRTAYYQQSGAFGFRDQLQDSLVYLTIDPSMTERQIKLHSQHQKEDGTVLHWWHPITETGLETKMTDDLLWLPFIVINYLEETDNYKFLEEIEPYYDNKGNPGSILNHCTKSIDKVLTRMSDRGLPLIGSGDWNDGLSAVGLEMKGESIWLAEFLYFILLNFSRIGDKINDDEIKTKYLIKAEELKTNFEKYAWDGQWYFRATKDNGEKIGSRECSEGKIFLNPQTWSVISGIASSEKGSQSMDSVTKYLFKNNGPLLLWPAYSVPDKYIGYLSRYAPGRRENGGVYTHAATWAIWAYSILKNSEMVYETFKRLCPVYNGLQPDKYLAESYVTPGNIDGPDSPNYGMGGWTWYTGSAAWFQKLIVEKILGIKPTEKGLLIDPCIPVEWSQYSVKRKFRDTIYNITVINKSGNAGPVKEISIDGKCEKNNIIEPSSSAEVKVEVFI